MRIETYAIIIGIFVAVITVMVWGEDGRFWKNWLAQAAVGGGLLVAGGVFIWAFEYGT